MSLILSICQTANLLIQPICQSTKLEVFMKLLITGANVQLGQDLKECDRREIEYIATDYLAGRALHVAHESSL